MNADDMVGGPLTVTIAGVKAGTPEQPVNVELVEYPGRPYKPSKSMRRILVAAWGKDASAYAGRRLVLKRNPDIRFGKDVVGGIEIAAMSHLDKPLSVSLTVTRGKRKPFKVEPLAIPEVNTQTGELPPIPEDVQATVKKAMEAGTLVDYRAWLTEQGAPAHILEYVQNEITKQENK